MELYIYDHCPFCTRARMIFGLKKLNYSEIILDNDDEKTPIDMIGKKSLPILKLKNNHYMGESLDIVTHIDSMSGDRSLIEDRKIEIENWIINIERIIYELAIPRWAFSDFKEFNKITARMYFINKKQAAIGDFIEKLNASTSKIDFIVKELEVLNNMISLEALESRTNSWSYTDILLFPILRSLSIVKGIVWPKNVQSWMEKMSEQCGIALHNDIAL
ncbi:glutaredoxin 2 [Acinetobacter sp. ANC 4173]|uniref:glutaredoxin 2 n=1 Tax=Acinetobacter sp. ANC 4173 TaxID=2529837 RepID=UPI00103BB96A|nr:glutaredoxin 2 [Acinetobacter sp. ANC 4173]TCB74462.1 glutaredoxin 2 [Acinetobacter sp. ANC 4173]